MWTFLAMMICLVGSCAAVECDAGASATCPNGGVPGTRDSADLLQTGLKVAASTGEEAELKKAQSKKSKLKKAESKKSKLKKAESKKAKEKASWWWGRRRAAVAPSHNNYIIENAADVGGFGGSCTCPDGNVYQVGDNGDSCGSLACVGGTSGTCNQAAGAWSNRKVVCAEQKHVHQEDCTSYVSDHYSSSREYWSGNRAGLYAMGSAGKWQQVTDFKGSLVNGPLESLGNEYWDPRFKKAILYTHGRAGDNIPESVKKGEIMSDGFCRPALGSDADYAKRFRAMGWNALWFFWGQYSWSPCGDLFEVCNFTTPTADRFGSTLKHGTIVSPKVWSDPYIRGPVSGTSAGNPKWAQFENTEACNGRQECPFNWRFTATDRAPSDPSLSIGNVWAQSLLSIADSLAGLDQFHAIGNSYGSQVTLHGTFLLLKHVENARLEDPSAFGGAQCPERPPVPTRVIFADPAYKSHAVDVWVGRQDPIFHRNAVPQLQYLYAAGIPVLVLHATRIANSLTGTVNTGWFGYFAQRVDLMMSENHCGMGAWCTGAHTGSVAWYFNTYFPPAASVRRSGGWCKIPEGTTSLMYGCKPDSEARMSEWQSNRAPRRIRAVSQVSRSNSPWVNGAGLDQNLDMANGDGTATHYRPWTWCWSSWFTLRPCRDRGTQPTSCDFNQQS